MTAWKQGLPTEPGWYWVFHKDMEDDEYNPCIVKVRDYAGLLSIGNSALHGWKRYESAWWVKIEQPSL